MIIKTLVILITLCLLLVTGGTLPSMGQTAPTPTPTLEQTAASPTKISFDSDTNDLSPVWSADGRSVLITRAIYPADKHYKTQFFEIALDHPDQPRMLLEIDGMISNPLWSPDRQRIAYAKDRSVFVQDRGGKILIQTPGSYALWSPDGTRLLVWSRQGLRVIGVDERSAVQLTNTEPTSDMFWSGMAWSPDGQQLVVTMSDDLYLFNTQDGTNINLTHSSGSEMHPMWSPDGVWIAFTSSAYYDDSVLRSDELHASPLYIMKPDGTGLTRLTEYRNYDTCPVWSPDGRTIAFVRGGDPENSTLFLLDLASKTTSWLDRPAGKSSQCAQWSPDGQQVLFQALFFEWEQGVSLYVTPRTAFITDIASATLLNRIAFLIDNAPTAQGISVRSAPGADNALIDKLSNGNLFQILGTAQAGNGDTWLHVLYKGDRTGWIHQDDLVYAARNLDPNIFCADPRPSDLIAALREAVRTRDGEALSRLITPSGLYMSFGGSNTLHLSHTEVQNLFNDHAMRNWGANEYSGDPILKSLADDVAAYMVRDLTPENVSIQCNDNQDDLSGRVEFFHFSVENYKVINFYSVQRPGAPGNELDWGAWGVAISYWEGRPVILGLTYYFWTP